MQINIFVVKTKIEQILEIPLFAIVDKKAFEDLETEKRNLIKLFSGLTEVNNAKGFWINKNDVIEEIEYDSVDIWQIFTEADKNLEECSCGDDERLLLETQINHTFLSAHCPKWKTLEKILTRIKRITKQNVQAFAIDNDMFYI
jgi:hypothetical protein